MADYITIQGDTWDSISLKTLGNENLMHLLIDANYQYRDIAVFSANCKLTTPRAESPREGNITGVLAWRSR